MDYNVEPTPDMNQQPQHLNTGRPTGKFADKKRLFMIVGIVVAVLLVAALVFFLLTSKKEDKNTGNNNQQNNSETSEETDEPSMPSAEASQLVTYKSTKMNFEITHRKDWKIKEATDRTQLVLTSPKVTYQTSDGESKQVVFTLKIGLGATDAEQETLDAAKIVKDSLLIGYDAPTESQRHYTNVSYAGEDEAFQIMVVTGSQALKAGAPLGVLIGDADFLIAGGFGADSQNTLTFEAADPTTIDQNTGYEQALAIVKSLKVY
jgi:hypothetical protein